MALKSIDSIRNAELSAAERIALSESEAKNAYDSALAKADKIISDAKNDAKVNIERKAEKAEKKAEEIIVTAQNSAKLSADKLKADALSKQDSVNAEILQIII